MTPTSANSVAVHVENMTKKDFKSAVDNETDHLVRGNNQMLKERRKIQLIRLRD